MHSKIVAARKFIIRVYNYYDQDKLYYGCCKDIPSYVFELKERLEVIYKRHYCNITEADIPEVKNLSIWVDYTVETPEWYVDNEEPIDKGPDIIKHVKIINTGCNGLPAIAEILTHIIGTTIRVAN